MSTTPTLNTQVIGQAENALGALMNRVLARTGGTFRQWAALNLTAVSGGAIDQITTRLYGDLPADDLATAGRVLTVITARTNAELAGT